MTSSQSVSCSSMWNSACSLISPPQSGTWRRVEHGLVLIALGGFTYKLYRMGPRNIVKATVGGLLAGAKVVPGLKSVVEAEEQKSLAEIEYELLGDGDPHANFELPEQGISFNEVVNTGKELKTRDDANNQGKKWGGIYHEDGEELTQLQNEMFALFNCTNALYPGVYPAVRKFEAELITMVKTMLHGDDDTVGVVTSGGTESILLAVLAYRNLARERDSNYSPEIICNAAAHAALDKASKYFDVKLVKLDLEGDLRLHAAQVEPYINKNTIAIYASAPTFPHGVIDPIPELGKLALKYRIGLHVDNCLGGFLLTPLKEMGLIPPGKDFDFDVPGVTSISCDGHKYGLASKGVSFVLFSDNAYRRATVCGVTDWAGGYYVTSTMQGSRSGAILANAWATMMYLGKQGYQQKARVMYDAHRYLCDEVNSIPDLKTVTDCDASIVSFSSDTIDVYAVAGQMIKKGWSVICLQLPPAAHICLGETTDKIKEHWVEDLKECANYVRNNPKATTEGSAGIYGTTAVLPNDKIEDLLKTYCDIRVKVKTTENRSH